MSAAPITLSFPMPPNVANSRMHNLTKYKAQKRYFAELDELQNCGLIPAPPAVPYARVSLAADMHLGKSMDDENAKYRCYKWPCDWLKTRGYIVDDKRKHCEMRDPNQIVKQQKDKRYYVHIFLTPLLQPVET